MLRLRELRVASKRTVSEVSSMIGVPEEVIFDYETGRDIPDDYLLEEFADFFDVTIEYLKGEDQCEYGYSQERILVMQKLDEIPEEDVKLVDAFLDWIKATKKSL